MSASARFWDRLANRYAKQPVADDAGYTDTLERVCKYLTSDARVLEVGGGTGSTALRLADAAGSIMCTDFSKNMVEIAKRKAMEANVGNVKFEVAEVFDAPGDAYDVVLAMNVLHLVANPAEAVHSLHGKLRTGGVLVSKTHILAGKWMVRAAVPVMRMLGVAPALTYFSKEDLIGMHEKAGFNIVETKEYDNGDRLLVFARKL